LERIKEVIHMKSNNGTWVFGLVLTAAVLFAGSCSKENPAGPEETPPPEDTIYSLTVTVNYSGAVPVSSANRLLVGLFSNPNLSGPPFASSDISVPNGGSADFTGITVSPVWVGVVADADGDTNPSMGEPVGVYVNYTAPTAVDLTSTGSISINFDDTYSWATGGSVFLSVDGIATNFQKFSVSQYDTGSEKTVVLGFGDLSGQGYPSVNISFPSNRTGTWNETTGAVLGYMDGTGTPFSSLFGNGNCSVTITSYGSVGGKIEGTFSALVFDATASVSNVITGGSFSVVRFADN
jgi:hypothetical protein